MHDIAFALRLTWQPTGIVHAMTPAAVQALASPRNSLNLDAPKDKSTASSESTFSASPSESSPRAVLASVSQSGESQYSEPGDPLGHSRFLSLPSLSSAAVGTLSVRETTGPSFSKISGEMRKDNVNAASAPSAPSAPSKEGLRTAASDNLAEVAPQPQTSRVALPSFMPSGSVSPPLDVTVLDALIVPAEVRSKAPASTPERAPSSWIISGRQATPPGDSGSVNDRDTAPSESQRKAPKMEILEKSSQIQVSNQPADHAVAGGSPAGVAVPGVALQTQTKVSVAPQPPTTVSPELQTANPVQSQPIREISFRLGADSSQVDVQVAQRAGKIQVAVRTADPELAKSLQTNLGEVVGRLEDKGFRTETWTPVSGHGGSALREPNSANSQSGDSSSQYSQQDRRQGQQESNQRQQQRWKAQLEDMFLAPSTPTNEGEQI